MSTPEEKLAAAVKSAAEKKVGGKAVDGGRRKGGIDCFALVDQLLKSVGAKTAADFGNVTPTADYVWGTPVALGSVQPGDIVQFRDHKLETRTETLGELKWEFASERVQVRPHHTAVVVEVRKDGSVVIVEQNVKPNPRKVFRHVLERLAPGSETRYASGKEKTFITVTGTAKAYRPVPRPKGASLLRPDEGAAAGGRRMLAHRSPGRVSGRPPGPVGTG